MLELYGKDLWVSRKDRKRVTTLTSIWIYESQRPWCSCWLCWVILFPICSVNIGRWWSYKRLLTGHIGVFELILQDPALALPERCRFHQNQWNPSPSARESFQICQAHERNCQWSVVYGLNGDNYWTVWSLLALSWSTSIFFALWVLWDSRKLYLRWTRSVKIMRSGGEQTIYNKGSMVG